MNGKTCILILLGLVILTPIPCLPQTTGAIAGLVVDENKLPLLGARVVYNNVVPLQRDARGAPKRVGPLLSASVLSGGTGEFLVAGLAAGEYYLCVIGTSPAHLKSCEWGAPARTVRLTAGQSVSNVVLTVRTGTLLKLRIEDPNSRIVIGPNPIAGGGGLNFVVGVISDSGHYSRGQLVSQSTTEVNYSVAVPKQTSVRLIVSTQLSVTDAAGNPVETSKPSLRVSTGQESEITVTLRVT